jgi:hypothetical protein
VYVLQQACLSLAALELVLNELLLILRNRPLFTTSGGHTTSIMLASSGS